MTVSLDERKPKIQKPQGPEYYISKKVGRAITDYDMISDGDRIAVAVSGGKDSLTLLKVLNDRLSFIPVKYELLAVHIDLGYPCMHPKILEEYFKSHGFKYQIKKIDMLPEGRELKSSTGLKADGEQSRAIDIRNYVSCFWCSWNRRKAIFETAKEFGCNKVALGHHRDDIVETILLNLFFQGEISAMSPKQELFGGALTIIRPLAYVEEREITRFVKTQGDFHHKCTCPNSLTSKRTKVEKILDELEEVCPNVRTNVFRSVKRIKKEYLL